MTTLSNAAQLEKQNQLHVLLEAFGINYVTSLGIESEEQYSKSNGGGQVMTICSNDVDFGGVFEEEKIEGLNFIRDTMSNGHNTPSWPVVRITFN